jgi:hypothetical protein
MSNASDKLKGVMTETFNPILSKYIGDVVVTMQTHHAEQLISVQDMAGSMNSLMISMTDLKRSIITLSDRVDALDKRTAMIITKLEEMRGGREVRGEHEPLVQRNAFSRPGADLPLNFTCD